MSFAAKYFFLLKNAFSKGKRRLFLLFFGGRIGRFLIRPIHQIIQAGMKVIRQNGQVAHRGQTLTPFVFGQKALINAGGNVQRNLRHMLFLPQSQQIQHTYRPFLGYYVMFAVDKKDR